MKVETVQDMGFIRETDRALARAFVSEFVRLQLIVGEDLNTSLRGLLTDLEVATNDLVRDLDIATRNSLDIPSANPSVKVALDHFHQLVRMKMALPLTQLDAAHEDMERFLQFHLSQLHAQTELKCLMTSLINKLASHQQKIQDLMLRDPLKNVEVTLRVLVGLGADQPMNTKFFPGIMEGLLGSIGINATGVKDPPTSSREGAARMWATTVQNAICQMEKKDAPQKSPLECH